MSADLPCVFFRLRYASPIPKDLPEAALVGCGLRNSCFLSEPFFLLGFTYTCHTNPEGPEENSCKNIKGL